MYKDKTIEESIKTVMEFLREVADDGDWEDGEGGNLSEDARVFLEIISNEETTCYSCESAPGINQVDLCETCIDKVSVW